MKRARPEERLQRDLVAYLRLALPKPWLVFHVPNGGARTKAEAGIFKAMGVLAGMPDLLVIGHTWIGDAGSDAEARMRALPILPRVIAIELKAPPKALKRGGVSKAKPAVSDAQAAVIADLAACGVPTLIARDLDETLRALTLLGVPLKGRQP